MMKRISTLICGTLLATSLSSPALAGGKTIAGSATTAPVSVLAAAQRYSDSRDYGARYVGSSVVVKAEQTESGGQESIRLTYENGRTITFVAKTVAYIVANYSK